MEKRREIKNSGNRWKSHAATDFERARGYYSRRLASVCRDSVLSDSLLSGSRVQKWRRKSLFLGKTKRGKRECDRPGPGKRSVTQCRRTRLYIPPFGQKEAVFVTFALSQTVVDADSWCTKYYIWTLIAAYVAMRAESRRPAAVGWRGSGSSWHRASGFALLWSSARLVAEEVW